MALFLCGFVAGERRLKGVLLRRGGRVVVVAGGVMAGSDIGRVLLLSGYLYSLWSERKGGSGGKEEHDSRWCRPFHTLIPCT